jgi:hypothetical protein
MSAGGGGNIMFHTFRLDSHTPATPKSLALEKKKRNTSAPSQTTPTHPFIPNPFTFPTPTTIQLNAQPLHVHEPQSVPQSPTIIAPAPKKVLAPLVITKKRPRNASLSIASMGADDDDMCESPVKRINYTPVDEAESGKEDDKKLLVTPTSQDPMSVSPGSPVGNGMSSAFKKRDTASTV